MQATQGMPDHLTQIPAASEVFLCKRTRLDNAGQGVEWMARFQLRDELRPDVASLISRLKRGGKRMHLLSGDHHGAVEAVAQKLDIDRYKAGATPADKQRYVAEIQSDGRTVLMIGDGINDAPVLASAHVSMAVGEATALARTAADVISLLPGLDGLEQLLGKSKKTMAIVKQNLFWAASYNAFAIPLAALGFVPPWAAAIGMAGSSLLVAANAQRLWVNGDNVHKFAATGGRRSLWNRYSF
jgi:Cu2+-exporting ATPase